MMLNLGLCISAGTCIILIRLTCGFLFDSFMIFYVSTIHYKGSKRKHIFRKCVPKTCSKIIDKRAYVRYNKVVSNIRLIKAARKAAVNAELARAFHQLLNSTPG